MKYFVYSQERRVNVHVVKCHSLLLGYPRRGDVDMNKKTTFMFYQILYVYI